MPELSSLTDTPPSPNAAEALTADVVDEVISSEEAVAAAPPRRRRVWLPVALFIATCFSTFWVGANHWYPSVAGYGSSTPGTELIGRQMVLTHWQDGLIYMVCVLAILMTHEMGHFLATVYYKIPASLPYVIPMPFMPLGTFGAVIGMDARRADRKQIFDIGIAGPLAGLVVAMPIMIYGVMQLNLTREAFGPIALHPPLLVQIMLSLFHTEGYQPGMTIITSRLNPYFMAGWVGLIITGLNMLPVSQLDGGHVIYTLFGKKAHWIARAFMVVAIGYIIYSLIRVQQPPWLVMVALLFFIGIDHPPTRDDRVPIGWFRFWLGLVSLAIPILCFAPQVLTVL